MARAGERGFPAAPIPFESQVGLRSLPKISEFYGVAIRMYFNDHGPPHFHAEFLNGPVFQPLLDPAVFARLQVDPEAGTIVWPNRADIAPETLYDLPDERAA